MKNRLVLPLMLVGIFLLASSPANGFADTHRQKVQQLAKTTKYKGVYLPVLMPDMVVAIVRSPSSAVIGQKLGPVLVIASNIGKAGNKAEQSLTVQLALSKDTIPVGLGNCGIGDNKDRSLGCTKGMSSVFDPGATWELNDFSSDSCQMTIPADVLPGDYYLIALVDGNHYIPESNEGNNISYAPIKITH